MAGDVLGYLISFRTYGTCLHGSDRPTVDDSHRVPGGRFAPQNPLRAAFERRLMKHASIELDSERRFVVSETIREVCDYREWRLHAAHVRTNHVHVVVSASDKPERVMSDLKAYFTRRMRGAGVLRAEEHAWAHHGSTRYLNTETAFAQAIRYVLEEQGAPLRTRRPTGWRELVPRSSSWLFR